MIETILITVLSSQLTFLKPTVSSKPQTPPIIFTRVLPEKNYVSYPVEENDTLKSISQKYFGTDAYWSNVWNANPTIADPDNLESGTIVNVPVTKNDIPESLTDILSQKNDALTNEKNKAYLQDIGYLPASVASTQQITPTVQPTATPAVSQNSASGISDEALTSLGNCEAGMNPTRNSGNGYYGAFQFSYGTWKSMNTGYERADLAPIEVQKAAVKQLLQRSSIYNQFPACANKMRTAGLI